MAPTNNRQLVKQTQTGLNNMKHIKNNLVIFVDNCVALINCGYHTPKLISFKGSEMNDFQRFLGTKIEINSQHKKSFRFQATVCQPTC